MRRSLETLRSDHLIPAHPVILRIRIQDAADEPEILPGLACAPSLQTPPQYLASLQPAWPSFWRTHHAPSCLGLCTSCLLWLEHPLPDLCISGSFSALRSLPCPRLPGETVPDRLLELPGFQHRGARGGPAHQRCLQMGFTWIRCHEDQGELLAPGAPGPRLRPAPAMVLSTRRGLRTCLRVTERIY